jgi:hypothetical protein
LTSMLFVLRAHRPRNTITQKITLQHYQFVDSDAI